MKAGFLVLADGTVFEGRGVGAEGVVTGEVVFNTSMTGYQEIITDPSYAGQIVVMTAPHIGNYGSTPDDAQSHRPHCAGFVMRSLSRVASNWRSTDSWAEYLREHEIVALDEVDTRRLTRHVRHHGAMPAAMGTGVDPDQLTDTARAAPGMAGRNLAAAVGTDRIEVFPHEGTRRGRIVAYDFGIKQDIISSLADRGLEVHVVPATTPPATVIDLEADGVFLSNGPGDPEPLEEIAANIGELVGRLPVFGICLGHQLLALAAGARTYKLPFGHHGGNHPVQRVADGHVEVTAQNHGFSVDLSDLPASSGRAMSSFGPVEITHVNLNDGTIEGLEFPEAGAFSVQYHPEAAPGPHDAAGLFDRFAAMVA